MNLESITQICILIIHIGIGIASLDVKFKNTTVGGLGVDFEELFEALKPQTGTAVDHVNLKFWCAVQCSDKDYCYFFTVIEDKCVLCGSANTDSTVQAYHASSLPDSTQINYKYEKTLNKRYQIGTTQVTYEGAITACASVGMQVVTFSSVQELQTVFQAAEQYHRYYWVGLTRQLDNSWVYGDGGADIPELWMNNEPNGNVECAYMLLSVNHADQGRFQDCHCESGNVYYICQAYSLV